MLGPFETFLCDTNQVLLVFLFLFFIFSFIKEKVTKKKETKKKKKEEPKSICEKSNGKILVGETISRKL